LLPDSGYIQEDDAKFYKKHKISKHENPDPLYDKETAEACLSLFQAVDFNEEFKIGDIDIVLQSAGHILGAASVILKADGKRVGFSGDVGRPDDIIMYPPKPLPHLDLLLLESTYGNRLHDKENASEQLAEIINSTVKAGGVLLIPSFALSDYQDKAVETQQLNLDVKAAVDAGDYKEAFSLNSKAETSTKELVQMAGETAETVASNIQGNSASGPIPSSKVDAAVTVINSAIGAASSETEQIKEPPKTKEIN
jgi:Cft2 family RNA processing exonuclease